MSIKFENEIPFVEEQNLLELANSIQTPFYVYSQKDITDTYLNLKNVIKKDIYFSIKANSNQAIIALLNSLGAGADIVSIEEMHRALMAGVNPEKIIFEGVGKSNSDLTDAINTNIRQINVESIEELNQVNIIAKYLKKKPRIGLRLNPDIDANTLDNISTGRKADKFGINFIQLQEVCELIKSLDCIELIGLSCHIGSQIFDLNIFEKTFNKMKIAINILKSNNLNINRLNLGGGFGIPYNDTQKKLDIKQLSILVEKIFPDSSFNISFEPGRYLVANSGFLITKIITTKQNGGINFLITDAGMQTLLRPAMYKAIHRIVPFNTNQEIVNYTVAGPICESSDILAKNIKLPFQKKDDFLIICDVGAYGSVMSSRYNSKCLPIEVLVYGDKYFIIRKQENIDMIIKKDEIPTWIKN